MPSLHILLVVPMQRYLQGRCNRCRYQHNRRRRCRRCHRRRNHTPLPRTLTWSNAVPTIRSNPRSILRIRPSHFHLHLPISNIRRKRRQRMRYRRRRTSRTARRRGRRQFRRQDRLFNSKLHFFIVHFTHTNRRLISNTKVLASHRRLRRRIQRRFFNARAIHRPVTTFRRSERSFKHFISCVVTKYKSSGIGHLRGKRTQDRRKYRVITRSHRYRVNNRFTRRKYLRHRQVPPNAGSIFITVTLPGRSRHRHTRGSRKGTGQYNLTRVGRSLHSP